MHVVNVNVTIHEREPAESQLREIVIPMVSQMPGFVAGYWLEPQDNKGSSCVFFESQEAAQGMADALAQMPPQGPVTLDDVTLRGALAHA